VEVVFPSVDDNAPSNEPRPARYRRKLDPNCIDRGADQDLDAQTLFDRLGKQFDLPAWFLDHEDGLGGEAETVLWQLHLIAFFLNPHGHPPKLRIDAPAGIEVPERAHGFAQDPALNDSREAGPMAIVVAEQVEFRRAFGGPGAPAMPKVLEFTLAAAAYRSDLTQARRCRRQHRRKRSYG